MGNLKVNKNDPVEALRKARTRPAVLKLQLAKLRSSLPRFSILVFEGDDDKIVYYQWIRRLNPTLTYASFPCNGKGQSLSLWDSVKSDKTGLSEGVYFFVDRDFDDLRGRNPSEEIFVTSAYSVENYLVCPTVLDLLLQIEFHCHASPEVRSDIVSIFNECYSQFLSVTRDINFRLYVARKLGIETKSLPTKIGKVADVKLNQVSSIQVGADKVVEYVDSANPINTSNLEEEFDKLDAKMRYRGKFAYMFFNKWLDHLADDGRTSNRGIFSRISNNSSFRTSEITLNNLASRSEIPEGLAEFVSSIKSPEA